MQLAHQIYLGLPIEHLVNAYCKFKNNFSKNSRSLHIGHVYQYGIASPQVFFLIASTAQLFLPYFIDCLIRVYVVFFRKDVYTRKQVQLFKDIVEAAAMGRRREEDECF